MISIPISEFYQDWRLALLKVQQGETVVLTDNDKAVAQLSPPTQESWEKCQQGLLSKFNLDDGFFSIS